jgi:hypothetical protein
VRPCGSPGASFTYTGEATSEYGAGTVTPPYGGQFTIAGRVNPTHTVVTATITLSDAQDPVTTGCTGTYQLIAIPTVNARATTGDKRAYSSQFVHFDYAAGVVRNLYAQANFECGPSEDWAYVNAKSYGYPELRTTAGGHFSLQLYVLDGYQHIVAVRITGHIHGRNTSGRTEVSEPTGGFQGEGGGACHGNRAWTASLPVPPAPPGPSAFFQWGAIRVAGGASWRYYFVAQDISCSHGATEIVVAVAGRSTEIPCSRSTAFASGPLAPSRTYAVTSVAVEARGGRIVKRGTPVTVPVNMPGPGDQWKVLTGLPGTPPS